MKRKIGSVLLLLVLLLLCGCTKQEEEHEYLIYYKNMDSTKIIPTSYEPKSQNGDELAMEMLNAMKEAPDSAELRQSIPEPVQILSCKQNGYMMTVDFNEAYYDLGGTEEVLLRAAVVRTLVQIDGISYVAFTVESQPLTYQDGGTIGGMNADSFVENPGNQINSSLRTTLNLYFASEDGTELVKETRDVHYSSNISLEKLVVEQLIEGPKTSGLKATIPGDTKLITISVVEGICYVNLDETFRNQNNEIQEPIVLYSIVNSLAELPGIDKVQISVNGDTKGKVRFTEDLSVMYERDDSYIRTEDSTEKK